MIEAPAPTYRIRAWRRARGLTLERLAEAIGMSHTNLGKIERGLVPLGERHIPRLVEALRIGPGDLFVDPSSQPERPGEDLAATIPVVGFVGAGDAAHYYETGEGELDRAPAPADATALTVARQIRGQSIGRRFDGWLIFSDEARAPVTEDLHGELCVCGLPDGRVLVKWLEPARAAGLHHLASETEPTLYDQRVLWAAKVTSMRPR